jgi:hypothetical protein
MAVRIEMRMRVRKKMGLIGREYCLMGPCL